MYNVGDKVEYVNQWEELKSGIISEVSSSMDSYGNMIVKDDVVMYESKKLTAKENKRRRKKGLELLKTPVYVPVKPKNMDSIYFTVPNRLYNDFVLYKDIIRSSIDGRSKRRNINSRS